jgi:hypothetical protein
MFLRIMAIGVATSKNLGGKEAVAILPPNMLVCFSKPQCIQQSSPHPEVTEIYKPLTQPNQILPHMELGAGMQEKVSNLFDSARETSLITAHCQRQECRAS